MAIQNEESLQVLPLPTVEWPVDLQINQFDSIFITTTVMEPLFNSHELNLQEIGSLRTSLLFNGLNNDRKPRGHEEAVHSWNYDENFPNEFDPAVTQNNQNDLKLSNWNFLFPIYQVQLNGKSSLIISINENFLKISTIFINSIANSLVDKLTSFTNKIYVIGCSERIYNSKKINSTNCTLQPPEFITGFIGSILTKLIAKDSILNFSAVMLPSEGPIGFEKLNIVMMDEIIDWIIDKWMQMDANFNISNYRDDCHRLWKLQGNTINLQSGLYI